MEIQEQETELEKRLGLIVKQIGKYAMLVACFVLLAMTILLLLKHIFASDKMHHALASQGTILDLTKFIIIALCILIVSIPEGLPQAISIAMALSVDRFRQSQILIKNLGAVQTCSMIHDVCMGKTGTLTTGTPKVQKYCIGTDTEATRHDPDSPSLIQADLDESVRQLIINMLLGSNEGRFEPNDETFCYEAKGSATE
jgi:P-type E1-E2 ATPase